MFSSIKDYIISKFNHKSLSKDERQKRFPYYEFQINPTVVRRTGISTNEISPKHIYEIIQRYHESLHETNHRYEWLTYWISIIKKELDDLSNYTMEDVGRVVIIQNDKCIFDFYLIYNIHLPKISNKQDVETVVINLNHSIDEPSIFSKIITSAGMIISMGSIGYLISNVI